VQLHVYISELFVEYHQWSDWFLSGVLSNWVSFCCTLFDFGLHGAVDKRPNGDCGSKDQGNGV